MTEEMVTHSANDECSALACASTNIESDRNLSGDASYRPHRGSRSKVLRPPPPVTWLASYPRSGSTLLRQILKHCFGVASQSLYQDHDFNDPALGDLVGHEEVGSNPRRFVQQARLAGRSLFVKTHELPPADGHPAIYVIRDGRSAVVSYTHYLRDVLHRDITLSEVIEGKAGPSWSQHVRAWALPVRPNTLVVRYEDLAAGNSKTLETIGAFIDHVLLRDFFLSFAHLHELNPSFFRRGSDRANIAEMDTASRRLFDQHHGDVLRAMGYGEGSYQNNHPSPPNSFEGT